MSLAVLKNTADSMQITPAFANALQVLESTRDSVLITGKAGAGKSTFLEHFRNNTQKSVVILAPTGVAALNVKGQTIHSFFKLAPQFIPPEKVLKFPFPRLLKALDVLVIDEISMVRADVFDAIIRLLRKYGRNPKHPTGGVQLCLVGDLLQLPPVVNRSEQEIFRHFYTAPYFFKAQCWAELPIQKIAFEEVFRQQDKVFIEALNRVRRGEISDKLLEYLNRRVVAEAPSVEGMVTLTTNNALADTINASRMEALAGRHKIYSGEAKGAFDKVESRLPAPAELLLKVGAQVMFTKNDTTGGRWVNGSLGIVKELRADSVIVEMEGTKRAWEVEAETWQAVRFALTADGTEVTAEETGKYKQLPLMPAWAVTIHKSQGKTLEHVVIDLGNGAFAPGQLYVALSRCRAFENIYLKRPLRYSDIRVDEVVCDFLQM